MSSRIPIIAGNWKSFKTIEEAQSLAESVVRGVAGTPGVEVVLCPPFVSLTTALVRVLGTPVQLGAQNAYLSEGAYTGEIAPRMLAGLCRYVILGHSERRRIFQEDDSLINAKVKAILEQGLSPILCVGETLEENERSRTEAVVSGQVRADLAGVEGRHLLQSGGLIAYEPVWAIGTGKACHGPAANEVIGMIRRVLVDLYGPAAAAVRIQYGGSANAGNIAEFMAQPEIDGALVGGASLRTDEFVAMVRKTAEVRGLGSE
jgi:triosephosphate isomerase